MLQARRSWWTAQLVLALVLTWFALPAAARAEEPAAAVPAGAKPGVHIVRPGDTLEQLASLYLGSAQRWPELARLNPDVHDPKRLRPGSRLNIFLVPSGGGRPAAQMEQLSKNVDERPSPIPWSTARTGDLLVEEDGVRTAAKSSAQMRFTDGTRLVLTEESLVFLRRSGDRLKASPRKAVEIVAGQADLSTEAGGRPAGRTTPGVEVEVRLGNAKATSRPNPAGALNARARRPGDGGAKVMLYGGAGEVEAGGAKVAVAEGMGTSVGKDGPPSPPEKLLPAPRLLSPPAGAELAFANPVFTWQPVPAADAYVVELCRDAGCGELLDRSIHPIAEPTTADTAEWHPDALPAGTFYWRITARSRSGLDGYPAEPVRLTLLSDRPDREPPTAKLTVDGPRIEVAGRLYTAGGLTFQIGAQDAGCGLLTSAVTVDGKPSTATGPWPNGEHTAAGYAVDRCGNRMEVPPFVFTVDTEPPTVRHEVAARSILEQEGEPRAVHPPHRRDYQAPAGTGLYWSSDGRRWLPLWQPATRRFQAVFGGDEMASEHPQVFLRGLGVRLSIDGQTVATGEGQLLWLKVEDAGAGVERLRFRVQPGPTGAPVLDLEATDLVGNARHLSWPLVVP